MTQTDEASRWFAILRRGMMSLEERDAYKAWLENPENRKAISVLEKIWSMLESAPKPVSRPHLPQKIIWAGLCVFLLAIGAISSMDNSRFWTGLDWVDR